APTITNAKPTDRDYTISDGTGLYLLVKTNARRPAAWPMTPYLSSLRSKSNASADLHRTRRAGCVEGRG
ncbi:hypothetical protein, partial [Staphylococcus aureus]